MTEQRTNRNPNLNPLALPLNGSALIEASAGTPIEDGAAVDCWTKC